MSQTKAARASRPRRCSASADGYFFFFCGFSGVCAAMYIGMAQAGR